MSCLFSVLIHIKNLIVLNINIIRGKIKTNKIILSLHSDVQLIFAILLIYVDFFLQFFQSEKLYASGNFI
jgi:hypothetical protein